MPRVTTDTGLVRGGHVPPRGAEDGRPQRWGWLGVVRMPSVGMGVRLAHAEISFAIVRAELGTRSEKVRAPVRWSFLRENTWKRRGAHERTRQGERDTRVCGGQELLALRRL
jgi:hypothetical protein